LTTGYKIASAVVVLLLAWAWFASYYGWGLASDASVKARNVRQGSIHGRRMMGGGPGFGK
jgi:hypothetical protein